MTWQPLAPDTVIGNGQYTIDRMIGSGGFGITYAAYDSHAREIVAIKEYFPRSAATRHDGEVFIAGPEHSIVFDRQLDRFWTEAWALNRFDHPHIVKFRHRFAERGTAYIVLEFIDGPTLEMWCQQNPPPPAGEIEAFANALVDAMRTIHRNKMLHRDIAPKNILLRHGLPVLVDFGSARDHDPKKDLTAMVSAHYAPYEQYLTSGNYQGPWTDIYAAAASLYRVMTGHPPLDAVTRSVDDTQHAPLARIAPRSYRSNFLRAVDWGLSVRPEDRPQTVDEWQRALFDGVPTEQIASGLSIPSAEPGSTVLNRFRAWFDRGRNTNPPKL